MDSLNMVNLANTLPSSAIAKAEQDTMDKFKAAAQSLTFLYRSSQRASKRHFDAGYATALEDILSVIQHGVSVGPDLHASANGGNEAISIGRILDWIEARQEGIRLKAREEEEEEEEREARTRVSKITKPSGESSEPGDMCDKKRGKAAQNAPASPTIQTSRSPTRQTSEEHTASPTEALETLPSPTLTPASVHGTHIYSSRPHTRARVRSQQVLAPLNASNGNSFISNPNTGSSMASVIGAKRRHATMIHDSAQAPVSISLPPSELRENTCPMTSLGDSSPQLSDNLAYAGTTVLLPTSGHRRRVRNSRTGLAPRSENIAFADGHSFASGDATMDVEDDSGRERKRATRR